MLDVAVDLDLTSHLDKQIYPLVYAVLRFIWCEACWTGTSAQTSAWMTVSVATPLDCLH